MLLCIPVKDTAHVGKYLPSEAWHPNIPSLFWGKEQGLWAGSWWWQPIGQPFRSLLLSAGEALVPSTPIPTSLRGCMGWLGGWHSSAGLYQGGGIVCTHFSSCSMGRVANGHGVSAEVPAPVIAPLQPPKALAHLSPQEGRMTVQPHVFLKASWVLGCSHRLELA